MSDYEPLNEEQRKVRNAVLIGVGVGVVGTALIMRGGQRQARRAG